jgi:hypothetical protein
MQGAFCIFVLLSFNNYFKNKVFRTELDKIISYIIDFRSYVSIGTIIYKRENTVRHNYFITKTTNLVFTKLEHVSS